MLKIRRIIHFLFFICIDWLSKGVLLYYICLKTACVCIDFMNKSHRWITGEGSRKQLISCSPRALNTRRDGLGQENMLLRRGTKLVMAFFSSPVFSSFSNENVFTGTAFSHSPNHITSVVTC